MRFFLFLSILFGGSLHSEVAKIGYCKVGRERPIDASTFLEIKLSLDYFLQQQVSQLILELDTPGGEVVSALKIVSLLKWIEKEKHIPVTAYINDWAISAGAFLAYSCRKIAIGPTASMGAAEPIVEGESEKLVSALRSEMANLALIWQRNPFIAQAMVDKDLLLVEREGEVIVLDDERAIRSDDFSSDKIVSAKGKLLTLNRAELKSYKVADLEADSLEDLLRMLSPQSELIRFHHWKLPFYRFISLPMIVFILAAVALLGIYLEFQMPGLLFPLIGAISSLLLLLLSYFPCETIDWMELIILGMGLLFIAWEFFLTASFGAATFFGFFLITGGMVAFLVPHVQRVVEWERDLYSAVYHLLLFLLPILMVVVCAIIFIPRFLLYYSDRKRKKSVAFHLVDNAMKGEKGISLTYLKPSGKVVVGGKIYDAVTEGKFVLPEMRVKVLRREGYRLWVEPFFND